jgi:hypothetical protein
MMKKKAIFITLVLIVMAVILMGCGSREPATPTTNPDLVYTAAAQAAEATLTQIFKLTPSATAVPPTPTYDPTQTAAAQTAVAMLTQIAAVSQTPQSTAANTAVPTVPPGPAGDRAVFVSDSTIPDGSVIAPGAAFRKTWKLQNGGTTTWTTSYTLIFVSGEQMGTIVSVPLTQTISPGQQVEVSVDMVAPTATGKYQGYWKMKNASGQLFNDSVYVLINVGSGGATPTTAPGTPGATPIPTSTGVPGNPINSLTMSVDEGTYLGQCPHLFTFAATFTLNQGATLTYNLEAFSDTPGFQFTLPGAQTSTFGPGTFTLSFPLEFTSSGTGWVRFRVTSPVDMTSNQASFSLTCTP